MQRAECAIGASYEAPARGPELLRRAARDIARMRKVRFLGAGEAADQLLACWHWAHGRTDEAAATLRAVLPRLERLGWGLYAASAQVALGRLLGGDEGAALVETGHARFRAQGVVNPECAARMQSPMPTR
jgi:hypothetical protein